jgi:hypothetical protein
VYLSNNSSHPDKEIPDNWILFDLFPGFFYLNQKLKVTNTEGHYFLITGHYPGARRYNSWEERPSARFLLPGWRFLTG